MHPYLTKTRLILGAAIITTGAIVALHFALHDPMQRLYDKYDGNYLTDLLSFFRT